MRKLLSVALPAAVAVGVVATAVSVTADGGDDASPADGSSAEASAGADDARTLDVVVLVPDGDRAADDRELVTEAVSMWQRGLDTMAEGPDLGWLRGTAVRVSAEPLSAGLDGTAYTVRDPEVVIVAASAPGTSDVTPSGVDELRLRDAAGELCDTVGDPFAYDTWSVKKGFRSHHSLPEGTWLQQCGDPGTGGAVCFAVNATIGPQTTMDDVFATFGLVSDEFGHCLSASDDYLSPG